AGARKGRDRRRLPHSLARGVLGPRRDGGIAGITGRRGGATPVRDGRLLDIADQNFDVEFRRECGWHANLSRGTLAHLIFRTHPAAGSKAWPTAKQRSWRSRRRACSRTMPTADFPRRIT